MVAGAIHTFIGATGLVGILLRFIGPMTIVPAVLLIGLYMIKATAKFVIVNIPVAVMYVAIAKNVPILTVLILILQIWSWIEINTINLKPQILRGDIMR